jgi:hypothetical protein
MIGIARGDGFEPSSLVTSGTSNTTFIVDSETAEAKN